MSFLIALLMEAFVMALVQRLWPARTQAAPDLAVPDADNDEEPLADFGRVRGDLERIHDYLADGRVDTAFAELERLLDVMDGVDEAAATDARWQNWQERNAA